MRLKEHGSTERRTVRCSHTDEQNGTLSPRETAQLCQGSADFGVTGIGLDQRAEFLRLLAAFDLQNFGARRRQQLWPRFYSADPARLSHVRFRHLPFPREAPRILAQRKTDDISADFVMFI